MNLKLRLNLIITSLLLLIMLAGIALSFNNARRNTLAEIVSAERSAIYLFDSAIIGTEPSATSTINLNVFKLQQLSHMRHLKIELINMNNIVIDSNYAVNSQPLNNQAPAWFEQLLNKTMPKWQAKNKVLYENNKPVARLVMTPDPTFEYTEIWQQMTDLLVLLSLFFVCVNLVIVWAIAQALKPTQSILNTLNLVESGDLTARLPAYKLPEMAKIGKKFNHMVTTLQQSTINNHKLTQQLMTAQEAERKSLARDLHDEFGQCLTAINTDANVILNQAKKQYPELQASAQAITQLSRHLMDMVSGLLQRLRPGVLDELGLQVALQDLVDNWRNRHEQIGIKLSMQNTDLLTQLDDTQKLVIYRLVQESLTNIARHAKAANASINVCGELKNGINGIGIKVQDDGLGFNPALIDGLGIAGMRERIESLNGDFSLQTQANKGCIIMIWLPIRHARG